MNFSLKSRQRVLITLGSAVATIAMGVSAVAQTRFCIGGDLDRLSAGERASCNAAKDTVKLTATRLHAPEDWHFVIVCGEGGWKEYTAVAQRGEVALNDSDADTDLDQHVTYLRESRLRDSRLSGSRPSESQPREPQSHDLQRVLAHELAYIEVGTRDERVIEARVNAPRETPHAKDDNGTGANHRGAKPLTSGL